MEHLLKRESSLENENCIDCKDATPLSSEEIASLSQSLENGWNVMDGHCLKRCFKFQTFQEALEFANRVGEISEEEDHHPTITIGWGFAEVQLYTHSINALSRNDFILASKISRIVRQTYIHDRYVDTD